MATNCWDYKKCGRENNGVNVHELGVCPAASATEADGFCGGKNGGRGCAFITGTFCGGVIQGASKDKEKDCANCGFYEQLIKEHGIDQNVLHFGKYVRKKSIKTYVISDMEYS